MSVYQLVVTAGGVRRRGTAWCLDNQTVITALHVVAERGTWLHEMPSAEVSYTLIKETEQIALSPGTSDPHSDVALLTVPAQQLQRPLNLASTQPFVHDVFLAEGFPKFHGERQFSISGRITAVRAGISDQTLQLQVDQTTDVSLEGFSGAPVLVNESVVGVITRDTQGVATAWAAPVTAIRRLARLYWAVDLQETLAQLLARLYPSQEILRDFRARWLPEKGGGADGDIETLGRILIREALLLGVDSLRNLLELARNDHPSATEIEALSENLMKIYQEGGFIPAFGHPVLKALAEHSTPILEGISSTVGDCLHLERHRLIQESISQLNTCQILILSGSAGSGKSGVAKDVVSRLSSDHFTFCFRAEEFAMPHIDALLTQSRIPTNAKGLAEVLHSQEKKVMLIESLERLLESSIRDAFTHMLALAAKDASWKIVVTCRDYSSDLVRAALVEPRQMKYSILSIPLLDDDELQMAVDINPALIRPLESGALRQLLRNPYILDKAWRISWAHDRPLPLSERDFRIVVWKDIIRADHHMASGMPRRREQVFMQVALRRAQTLRLYALCKDLDPEVIEVLRLDSLITSPDGSKILAAPSHDVLEDWAILQWIDEEFVTHDDSLSIFSQNLGAYPAVRRSLRKWIGELVERLPSRADELFVSTIQDSQLAAHFRDDILVSLLKSTSATDFLRRHRDELFSNQRRLLRLVIHLLRVACVVRPAGLDSSTAHASMFNRPDGLAWACVLHLISENLDEFAHHDRDLLLTLIKDWARGVTYEQPYPDGANSAAAIAFWLLPHFSDYGYSSKGHEKDILQVIAKIPKAAPQQFEALLSSGTNDTHNRAVESFQEMVLDGLDGMPAARDFPDIVIKSAREYFLCNEESLSDHHGFGVRRELEVLFGVREERSFGTMSISALRGPWLTLLRHHPRKALEFIQSVFDHSAEWYAYPRVRIKFESPTRVFLRFKDGTSKEQWFSERLWSMYRGISGPHALNTVLMAFEYWLLEFAQAAPEHLDSVLLQILKRSTSAAVSAAVASVATAHPRNACETLLSFLRAPEYILADRHRLANESQTPSRIAEVMPSFDALDKFYESERKQSDSLAHRRHDLEWAIMNLQLGPSAAQVHEILDQHRASTPASESQSERDLMWRLAIHRMDLRHYKIVDDGASESAGDDGTQIRIVPSAVESDLKDLVQKSAHDLETAQSQMGSFVWGKGVFEYTAGAAHDPSQWRAWLLYARRGTEIDTGNEKAPTNSHVRNPRVRVAARRPGNFCRGARALLGSLLRRLGRSRQQQQSRPSPEKRHLTLLEWGGIGYIAAVCVRDHWDEMSPADQNWCVDYICDAIASGCNNWSPVARIQRGGFGADRPSASVLSLLIGKELSASHNERVRRMLVLALTHANDEVRLYAAAGVGDNLWKIDASLTQRCVFALAVESLRVDEVVQEAEAQVDDEFSMSPEAAENFGLALARRQAAATESMRRDFFTHDFSADFLRFDPSQGYAAKAHLNILRILLNAPAEPLAISAFKRLGVVLVGWWDLEENRRHDMEHRYREAPVHHELVFPQMEMLARFLIRTTLSSATDILKPILESTSRHPDKVAKILMGLITAEDQERKTEQFWSLWSLFANEVKNAEWIGQLNRGDHPRGSDMLSAIFLGPYWKEDIHHWGSVEGHQAKVGNIFEGLPASPLVLDFYLQFLHRIGETALPEGFVGLSKRAKVEALRTSSWSSNSIFLLEVLLQKHVYGCPLELKQRTDLREAVLLLLDVLVEKASSAAFRMRDDFVTPLSP